MSIPIVRMNAVCFMVMIHGTLELCTPEMCDASCTPVIVAQLFFSCLLHSAFWPVLYFLTKAVHTVYHPVGSHTVQNNIQTAFVSNLFFPLEVSTHIATLTAGSFSFVHMCVMRFLWTSC